MARDNRADNRAKAKAASNGAAEEPTELDLLNEAFKDNEADETDEDAPLPDKEVEFKTDDQEDSSKTPSDPDTVSEKTVFDDDKKGNEEAKKAAEADKAEQKAADTLAEDKKSDEDVKKAEEEAKKAEPSKEAEPATKEEKKTEEVVPPKQLTDEEASKLFSEWRGETESLLAQHHYRLSEKDVEEFNENPAAFIPKYAARVYLDSIQAAFQQFTTHLPQMVDQVLNAREQRSAKEKAFFDRWPKLVPHKDTVYRLATAYRAANPVFTQEQFINDVGAQAHVALRITPDGFIPAETPVEEKKPFVPAGTSSAPPPPPPQKPTNPFDALAQEFSMEEAPDDN